MLTRRRILLACFVSLSVVGLTALPSAASGGPGGIHRSRYAATNLGTLGGAFSVPIDLNDSGTVVGVSVPAGDTALRGFVWRRGVMIDIGSLGGPQAGVSSINSSGQVVGFSDLNRPAAPSIFNTTSLFCNPPVVAGQAAPICHAILRDRGHLVDLGTLGGQNSAAGSVNDRGQVVGVAETRQLDPSGIKGARRFHAFLWQRDSKHGGRAHMTDLGTLGTDPDSGASDINDHGQIIGGSVPNGAAFDGRKGRAFTWKRGHMTALRTLGGTYSHTGGINSYGDIVGASNLAGDLVQHATLWRHGHVIDLGTLPGDTSSEANDITDRGLIVGTSCNNSNGCRAVRWHGRQLVDLTTTLAPTAKWRLLDAQAVNSHGQIIGDGEHADQPRGYLLNPRRPKCAPTASAQAHWATEDSGDDGEQVGQH
jgi:probable HAF family extracellular repeat protein